VIRALVVDDALTARAFHRSVLEEAGYAVEEAVNGMEALEHVATGGFDLYVVDLNMPVMDGIAFLRALRARDMRHMPAILVTAETGDHDRELGLSAGANVVIHKPADPARLVTLARLLAGEDAP
jgi:two-component system, chemotaxis family, chemotaxis protein CheY